MEGAPGEAGLGAVTRREKGGEGGFAGGGVDDAAPDAGAAEEDLGQAEGFAEPVGDAGFEFGGGGAGDPEKGGGRQGRGEKFAEAVQRYLAG